MEVRKSDNWLNKRIPDIKKIEFYEIPISSLVCLNTILLIVVWAVLSQNIDTAISAEQPDFKVIIGEWVRPDGGYILKINSIDPDGRVKAGYYNPNPIHVGEAFIPVEKKKIRLFIKLHSH